MSFFAFYDHTSAGRGWRGWVLAPVQRAVCRVMRPAFYRLRDLLQFLNDRQDTQQAVAADLESRVGGLEIGLPPTLDGTRALIDSVQRNLTRLSLEQDDARARDRSAVRDLSDRVDEVLRRLAEHVQLAQAHQQLAQLTQTYQQLAHAYRALAQDHAAACRRIALLEDVLLQAATGPQIALVDRADTAQLVEARKAS